MKFILSFVFIVMANIAMAAPDPPQPLPMGPPPPGDPIDGWVFAVFIVGLIFGFYKIKNTIKHQLQ